ncbi:MAG: site-2 protease family protein [Polyangiaceae bacterium]
MPESLDLLQRIVNYVPVLLSLSVHEWAHARVAYALGDDTAARQGRLTLNPIVHIDLLGTLLPLMGFPFGWAKPVPVNASRFNARMSMRSGMMLTAAAGPLSNLALALLAAMVLALLRVASPEVLLNTRGVLPLFGQAILVNLALAAFNLLPIFPLDGSRIVDGLVPHGLREKWEKIAAFSPLLLIVVIFGLPYLGVDLFGWVGDGAQLLFGLALGSL